MAPSWFWDVHQGLAGYSQSPATAEPSMLKFLKYILCLGSGLETGDFYFRICERGFSKAYLIKSQREWRTWPPCVQLGLSPQTALASVSEQQSLIHPAWQLIQFVAIRGFLAKSNPSGHLWCPSPPLTVTQLEPAAKLVWETQGQHWDV